MAIAIVILIIDVPARAKGLNVKSRRKQARDPRTASLFSPMLRAALGDKKRAGARRFFKKSGNGGSDWT